MPWYSHAVWINKSDWWSLCMHQEAGMLEQLAEHLPEEHRNMEGLLAVAASSQVQMHLTATAAC